MQLDDLPRLLAALAARSGGIDLGPHAGAVREALGDGVRRCFDDAAAPDGTPWAPRQGHPPGPPLVRSGALRRAAEAAAGRAEVRPDGITIPADGLPDYGRWQQGGTRRIPARPFLGAGADAAQRVADGIAEAQARALEQLAVAEVPGAVPAAGGGSLRATLTNLFL